MQVSCDKRHVPSCNCFPCIAVTSLWMISGANLFSVSISCSALVADAVRWTEIHFPLRTQLQDGIASEVRKWRIPTLPSWLDNWKEFGMPVTVYDCKTHSQTLTVWKSHSNNDHRCECLKYPEDENCFRLLRFFYSTLIYLKFIDFYLCCKVLHMWCRRSRSRLSRTEELKNKMDLQSSIFAM